MAFVFGKDESCSALRMSASSEGSRPSLYGTFMMLVLKQPHYFQPGASSVPAHLH